jgi:hypothetical protein
MGILRQAKGISAEVVEAASLTALTSGFFTGKYFGIALSKAVKNAEVPQTQPVIEHGNIRGAAAFSGGVKHA